MLRVLKDDMAVFDSEALVSALTENAKLVDSRCYFPRNTNELNLIYRFTDRMVVASKDRGLPIAIVFNLHRYLRDVTEYAEHLHSIIALVALKNTAGFLRELTHLDKEERLNILENLEYLPSMKAIERLRLNLRNINSKEDELRFVIEEAEAAINQIFER